MVTEGLNRIAIAQGKKAREALEADVIDLDVQVAQMEHEHDNLVKQVKLKHAQVNKLWRIRKEKSEDLIKLDDELRLLGRPRAGFPELDDIMYESRVHRLRVDIQERSEKLAKRDTWSE